MIKIIRVLLVLLIGVSVKAQSKIQKKQKEDFQILKTVLTQVEANPYRRISKDSLNYYFN